MKFQSKTGTWVIMLQGILLLIDDTDWQLTVACEGDDTLDLAQFLENIEENGDHDIKVDGIFGCTLTYLAETDEIKVEELEEVSHAWYVTPEDFHKILA